MKPFKQNESAMTRTAKVLAPSAGQGYSANIQQNEPRKKAQAALNSLKSISYGGAKNVL